MKLVGRKKPSPRFMHRAEPFMIAAASASRQVGHDYIGTEHLLLALAEEAGSPAARVLAGHGLSTDRIRAEIIARVGTCDRPRGRLDGDALAAIGIDLDEVRRRVEGAFGPGALEQTCAGSTPIMPRLKRALELAVGEAGERPLSPSDVLVGLASVGDGVAARILADHQITLDALRAELADRAG